MTRSGSRACMPQVCERYLCVGHRDRLGADPGVQLVRHRIANVRDLGGMGVHCLRRISALLSPS